MFDVSSPVKGVNTGVLTFASSMVLDEVNSPRKGENVAHEERLTDIEKLLGFEFVSDPRKARFPLPGIPADHPAGTRYVTQPITFTPEEARDILKYRVIRQDRMPREIRHDGMCNNRRFLITTLRGNSRRKGLIAVVKDGEWNHRTSQTVAFTREGFLLDGQHRFAACALGGKEITFPVMLNADWDIFDDIDSGRGRGADQLLGDVKYPIEAATAARMLLPVVAGVEREHWSFLDAPNQDVIELINRWPFFHGGDDGGIVWMREVKAAQRTRIPIGPLAASVMAALAAGADPFHVQEFLDGLKDSFSERYETIGTAGRDPRHMLRSIYLRRDTRKNDALERRRQVGHCRRAMQVWLDWKTETANHELQKLPTVSATSDLPEVWRADEVRKFHYERVS